VDVNGIYSRNRFFDTIYLAGAQNLPELEEDVYVEPSITTTTFESYEDYLADGWAEFIRDFSE
jgi:hypothetical protein